MIEYLFHLTSVLVTLFAICYSILQGILSMVPILSLMLAVETHFAISAYYKQKARQIFKNELSGC